MAAPIVSVIFDNGIRKVNITEKDIEQQGKRVLQSGVVNLDRWAAGIAMAQSSAYEKYLNIAVKYSQKMLDEVETYSRFKWTRADLGGAQTQTSSDAYMIRGHYSQPTTKSFGKRLISATPIGCDVPEDSSGKSKAGKTNYLINFRLKNAKTFSRASTRLGLDEPPLDDSWYVSIRQNTKRRKKLGTSVFTGNISWGPGGEEEEMYVYKELFGELKYTFEVELLSRSPVTAYIARISSSNDNQMSVTATAPHKIEPKGKKKLLFWWHYPPVGLGLPDGGAAFMTEYVYNPGNIASTEEFERVLNSWVNEFVDKNSEEINSMMNSGYFAEAMALKSTPPRVLRRGEDLKFKSAKNFARNFKVPGRIQLVDD